MQLSNRAIGLLAVLGGVLVIWGTLELQPVPGQAFGSAFFPRILGGALICTGIVQTTMRDGAPFASLPGWLRGRGGISAAAVVAAVLAWLFLAERLGFLLTTGGLMIALALVLGARPLAAILTGAGMAAVFHLIFSSLLRVPLPRGLIEAWL